MAFASATKDFMGKPAPAGYIAGLGRGATGFTTRSDIGPAREASAASLMKDREDEDERFTEDPENETGLFNSLPYEADDEEADKIYAQVDSIMSERRKSRREAKERERKEKLAEERPKLTVQFADAKRALMSVSEKEWEGIPEAANISRRKAKKDLGRERFIPVPESVISSVQSSNDMVTSIDPKWDGIKTDFVEIGVARDRVLGVKLDQVSDSVTGQTVVDPKGYLTDLSSLLIKSEAEIGDIKKARLLLKSVITTNKHHAPGWIAAARLEEIAGKTVQARNLIAKGCEECPKHEDIWLEAARLNTVDNAKVILANAVRQIPNSVKIWLHAAQLETEAAGRKRVLRRALEFIPNSVKLWKAVISLEENETDAKILLSRAVECVPLSIEMWLTLAKLETYENARKVLNKARLTIPTSHEIWIAAAKLEESQGHDANIDTLISKAIASLSQKGKVLTRDQWLVEAQECEQAGAIVTCRALVKHTIGLDLDPEEYKSTWINDAEMCCEAKCFECARAVYAHALSVMPQKKSLWRRAAELEKDHGTREALLHLLESAVKACPHAETLWLMAAKEKWMANDIDGARATLAEAFRANPASPQIWLAAVKLEQENKEYDRTRMFLARAREQAGNEPRVWMKSATLERLLGSLDTAVELVQQGIERFPGFAKFWMIWSQIELQRGNVSKAREVFTMGLRHAPTSIPLWLQAAQLEEEAELFIKARAVLEKARLMNPKTPDLWHASIQLELRAGHTSIAKSLVAKALQECPDSGLLWAEAIFLEPRPQRRAKSIDGLKKCGESDLHVILAIARLFWLERKADKARSWFHRAVKVDPDYGDAWAFWFRFECLFGSPEQQSEVIQQCILAAPKHGPQWAKEAKALENVGKQTEDILKLVALKVPSTV